MAGSSHTVTTVDNDSPIRRIITAWVADDTDASVPTVELAIEGRLILLRTNPGSTAPADNYDITLVDSDGVDQLQGVGANRDTANTEEAVIVYASSDIHPYVTLARPLTLTLANVTNNDATGTIEIDYLPLQ